MTDKSTVVGWRRSDVTPIARDFTVGEGLLFALGSGLAYALMLWINSNVIQVQDAFPGVAVFFLPAGVKLLALLIGRLWGALGLMVANFLLSFGDWPGTSPLVLLSMAMLWTGLPLLIVLGLARLLKLRTDLRGITFTQFVIIDATTASGNALVYNAYLMWLGHRNITDYAGAVSAMALGDFLGTGALILLTVGVLTALRKRR